MQVLVNGKIREVNPGMSVADLVDASGLGQERIAIERNGDILDKADFTTVTLSEGDKLEIVRFVGGG